VIKAATKVGLLFLEETDLQVALDEKRKERTKAEVELNQLIGTLARDHRRKQGDRRNAAS
jgi:hypothetical protein